MGFLLFSLSPELVLRNNRVLFNLQSMCDESTHILYDSLYDNDFDFVVTNCLSGVGDETL